MQHYPYILIGQGISGTTLSLHLANAGIKHLIIDQPELSSSSKIAAGLVNPIVLKRLKKVRFVEDYLLKALSFYQEAESTLGVSFTHLVPILHRFHNQEEQNHWLEKSEHPGFAPFLDDALVHLNAPYIPAPFGFGRVPQSFWVDTHTYCTSFAKTSKHLIQHTITPESISWENKLLTLGSEALSFEHLIDCSGHLAPALFPELKGAFTPTRGEVLIIRAKDLSEKHILHAGIFILPLGNKHFKVGASYHWDTLTDTPTETGKSWLVEELEKLYTGPYEIVEHQAGVRPNIKDRTPLIGALHDKLYCFNGMGSRAALMAPYLADLLVTHITDKTEVPTHFLPTRFT
jgi:glycine/D-amino acid oxidase-like deaminating enzyme